MEINFDSPQLISIVSTLIGVGLIFLSYQISFYMKAKYKIKKELKLKLELEKKENDFIEAKKILNKPLKKTITKSVSKVIKEDIKKDLTFRELKPFVLIKFKLTDFKSWKDWYRNKFQSDRVVLINMELLNGMNRLFLAKEKDGGFQYRTKQFIFDDDSKYYVLEAKLYAFDFHEGFVLPIKRKIPITSIKENIQEDKVNEIEYATNPDTLQNFMVAKIAEGIMKGAEIDAWMKQIRILLIIFGLVVTIHFFLYAQKSGVFAQLGG